MSIVGNGLLLGGFLPILLGIESLGRGEIEGRFNDARVVEYALTIFE